MISNQVDADTVRQASRSATAHCSFGLPNLSCGTHAPTLVVLVEPNPSLLGQGHFARKPRKWLLTTALVKKGIEGSGSGSKSRVGSGKTQSQPSTQEDSTMSKQAAEHHKKAAEHFEHAARHHKEAAKHHEAGAHEKAAHHAHVAHGHHLHARHHAEEAAKSHVEHHGKK